MTAASRTAGGQRPPAASTSRAATCSGVWSSRVRSSVVKVAVTTTAARPTSRALPCVQDRSDRLIWIRDERGFLTRLKYDLVTGALTQRIDDVDTAQVADEPEGWETPTGSGLHLVTDFQHDDRGRGTETLGPVHTVDIDGTATSVRGATWTVFKDAEGEIWTGQGYASGANYDTYTLINPVSITKADKAGNVLEQIRATRSSTSGKLQASDEFPQSSYVAWTTNQYTECCALDSTRVYHTIPASDEGLPAIRQLISEGINVNVTLLFGLPRYRQVTEAYLAGIEEIERRYLAHVLSQSGRQDEARAIILRARRLDPFYAMNHAMFSPPNTVPANTNFGEVNKSVAPEQRRINLACKLTW